MAVTYTLTETMSVTVGGTTASRIDSAWSVCLEAVVRL